MPRGETHLPFITGRQAAECRRCDCDLVYPVAWEQQRGGTWMVTLRCPNCETRRKVFMSQHETEVFDSILDRGTDAMVRDLRNLTYANMSTEIEKFVEALDRDQILPEDIGACQ